MNILLIGGTGVVGSYLLPELVAKKYNVFALTRSEERIQKINSLGATGILGDILRPGAFIKSISNVDLIILLAMPNVKPGKRVTRKMFKELKEETNGFFKNSMELAVRYSVPVILPGGTSYHTAGNEMADETWPIRRTGLTRIGSDTDKMVNDAIQSKKPGIIQLIYGKIYGNGGLFRFMYDMVDKGRFKIIGKGENYIPNIHAKDAALAIIKAAEILPVGEKFIIADDEHVSQKDFAYYMADMMGRKRPGRVPGFIIKAVIGGDLYEIIKMDCRVSNAKAKRHLHWKPEYPSYKEGLKAVIQEIKKSS